MSFERDNQFGKLSISKGVIANIAGGAATECYGVVGMASQNILKDGFAEVLGMDNFAKGIEVRFNEDKMSVDLYIIVAYGMKISEIAAEVQKKTKFVLESTLDVKVDDVNVYIQDIKNIG